MGRNVQRIVLVEPEGVLAEVTAFRLELHGYAVEVVDSADAALKAVACMMPDLIITNLSLSGTSALSLIETLKSQEISSGIPVMVLSLDADLDRVTAVHQAGASDFLVVPFQPDVLQEKVVKLLSRPRVRAEEKEKVNAG